LIFQTNIERRSPGFEVNDLGYLRRADQLAWSTWAGYFDRHTRRLYQRFQWNFNWWQYWTTAGLPEERAFNTNTHTTFRNQWSLHFGGTAGQLGTTYCYDCARGGPAVRQGSYVAPWLGINGDDRKAIVPYVWFNWFRGDGGRSSSFSFSPELDFKIAARVTAAISPSYSRNRSDVQPLGIDKVTHYLFAHLEQKQLGMTMRVTYPFTANATLQVYAQPFISKGRSATCASCLRTRVPAAYDNRYQAYADTAYTNNIGGFNFKQFRSNVGLPGGSTGRGPRSSWCGARAAADPPGSRERKASAATWATYSICIRISSFLVKLSYWTQPASSSSRRQRSRQPSARCGAFLFSGQERTI